MSPSPSSLPLHIADIAALQGDLMPQ
jgi:hypothetical protein